MPRDIPVGNGKLLVCFDEQYCIRELYFPHVGKENHVTGNCFRFGVWVDSQFSWVETDWDRDLRYESDTLVTTVNLYHKRLGIRFVCHDAVDFHENCYLREISLQNLHPKTREIRLFFSHDFDISGNSVGDTAAYDPKTGGVVHYKGPRYFLANGFVNEGEGLAQFATGQKGIGGKEGTFRDAEDGLLSGNAIAQGSVDSVIALSLTLTGMSRVSAYYWIAAGQSWEEVRLLDSLIKQKHPKNLIQRTRDYWHLWVRKESPPLELLPEKIGETYRRSLLVLRTQIDWQGGILAANDSDVIQFNRDTYSYIWPRDGALVANAMDLAGYPVIAQNFYNFVAGLIEKEGYLLHKYNPDGTLASSWHPWFRGGKPQLPIQEDETALVIWALWNHFVFYRDIEFIKPLYKPVVKRGADFMCHYRDSETGLPGESYDLWEEQPGIFGFTVGTVFGGLTAASLFCTVFGENKRAEHYLKVAAEIRDAASLHLWHEDLNRFCRMIYRNEHGDIEVDRTCDASLWGLFAFGLYSVDDPRITSTMKALKERLWVKTSVGGMARYEDDYYHRIVNDVPGNPWFICTLWLADYLIERARNEKDLEDVFEILTWVSDHALPSGVLAEQVHPLTGKPLSVSPLTWSHSTFVVSTQRLLGRLGKIKACPECGASWMARAKSEDWIDRLYTDRCDSIHGICQVR
ncbi:MAG: glycoside hydrolase family 15 protein [Desulfobacterales bacterium]|nr:glycoside hydrolase family 15 protein [Desulfobacterales bacterium]